MYKLRHATFGDIDHLVNLHLRCFTIDDSFMMLFGNQFVKAAYHWFVVTPSVFVLVAVEMHQVVGVFIASDRPCSGPMLRACWIQAMIGLLRMPWLAFNPELLIRLFRVSFRKKHSIPQIAFYTAYSMVDPKFRRKGLITAVRKQMVHLSREMGFEVFLSAALEKIILQILELWKNWGLLRKRIGQPHPLFLWLNL